MLPGMGASMVTVSAVVDGLSCVVEVRQRGRPTREDVYAAAQILAGGPPGAARVVEKGRAAASTYLDLLEITRAALREAGAAGTMVRAETVAIGALERVRARLVSAMSPDDAWLALSEGAAAALVGVLKEEIRIGEDKVMRARAMLLRVMRRPTVEVAGSQSADEDAK